MRADYTDDNKNDVMNRAVFDVTYFVPAFRNDSAQLTQGKDNRLSFNENQQARFVLVENPQGEKYIPAFTSTELLTAFRNQQPEAAQNAQSFVMTFADLAGVTESFGFIERFVINPFDENLPFTKDFILAIKQNLQEQMAKMKQAQQNSEDSAPDITMSTNKS
jgi:hypothetical protein